MSSIKWNITKKMEWMGRRLRRINGSEEIKEWAAAMSALNVVLQELDIKVYSDNWRPWKRPVKGGMDDLRKMSSPSYMETEHPTTGIVGGGELLVKPVIPPMVDIEDIDMSHRKAAVMEMLKHPQKENYGKIMEGDGDVSLEEEDIQDQQEMKQLLEELSLTEKNRDGDVLVRNEVDGNIGIGVKGGNDLTEHLELECSEGHEMKLHWIEKNEGLNVAYTCDVCNKDYVAGCGKAIWRCPICDFDLCKTCRKEREKIATIRNEAEGDRFFLT